MRHESINLLEFQKRFPDDATCVDHLWRLRWPNGFKCPRCGNRANSFIKSRRLYQCKACRYQASVTAGTVFHKTRTPIHKWFWMIFMMTRQKSGVAMLRMQALLGIGSYKTVWMMGHKIRKGMEDRDSHYWLGGLIEMDGTFQGPRRRSEHDNTGRPSDRIAVCVERKGRKVGYCALRLMDDADARSLLASAGSPLLRKDSTPTGARTDVCRPAEEKRGTKEVAGIQRKGDLKSLKWIYVAMAKIKGNLRGVHHGVSRKHLQRYLSEFFYRFNRRQVDSQLLNRALVACLSTATVTLDELKA